MKHLWHIRPAGSAIITLALLACGAPEYKPVGAGGAGGQVAQGGSAQGGSAQGGGASPAAGAAGASPAISQVIGQCYTVYPTQSGCDHCVAQHLLVGVPKEQTLPCICQTANCREVCGDSYCHQPDPNTTLPGDPCDLCIVRALAGACAGTWQDVCAKYAGLASPDGTLCAWPSDGLGVCGH
ncbi:MAG: hypothetical protein IT374_14555 [Polyangiaceae bacterium]|nr:hypothetical protein [Polyangiaceae bacterium]